MSSKRAATGEKRKGAPSDAASSKKMKLQSGAAAKSEEVESDSSLLGFDSDSDGGVKLEGSKGPNGQKSEKKSGEQRRAEKKARQEKKAINSATAAGVTVKTETSRESHAKQKQIAKERKAAKPLADEIHRTKKIWERLRRKSHVPVEERKKLIEELYTIITGRMKDFVLKHDAVRAVQTAIKYATAEQRKMIAKELKGSYSELAESRYAKFLIGKLLAHDDAEIRGMVIPEFYGRVKRLINHPEAAWILDDIYRGAATEEQKAMLLREWYGPEFAIMERPGGSPVTSDLSKILEDEPAKRGPIMKNLYDMINRLVQKKMTGFTMLHDAMLQYFRNAKLESEEYNEFLEMIKGDEGGDLVKNMAFTRSGSRLICLLFAHGTAKDRRQLLKTYKDTFVLMSGDQFAHIVILVACDVTDDTKMTSKAIFPELFGDDSQKAADALLASCGNLYARTTLLYLLDAPLKTVFPASMSGDLEILREAHAIREKTSKKDPEVRKNELIAAMASQLLAGVVEAAPALACDGFGCQLMAEILFSCPGDKTGAMEAIAGTAAGSPDDVGMTEGEETDGALESRLHVSKTPHGGRLMKSLIAGGRFDKEAGKVKPVEPRLKFSNILYPVIKDYIMDWATGPSSFAVLGLVESDDFDGEFKEELQDTLRSNRDMLEKAATAEAVGDNENKSEGSGKARKKKGPKKPSGNQGSRLLLEKLG